MIVTVMMMHCRYKGSLQADSMGVLAIIDKNLENQPVVMRV